MLLRSCYAERLPLRGQLRVAAAAHPRVHGLRCRDPAVADELGCDCDGDAALLEAGDERVAERVQAGVVDPDLGERVLPGTQYVAP